MKTDNYFKWSRFYSLCKKDMIESWRTNLLRLAMLYGAIVVVMLLLGMSTYQEMNLDGFADPFWRSEQSIFRSLVFVFGAISASTFVEKMKTKEGRLSTLMLPTTIFEKYLERWIFTVAVFFVVYVFAFVIADLTRVLVFSLAFPKMTLIKPISLHLLLLDCNSLSCFHPSDLFSQVFMDYCFLQSFFVLGSTIWQKSPFIKTFAAGIILAGFYGLLFWLSFEMADLHNVSYNPNPGTFATIYKSVVFLLAVFNFVVAYFRLKESEIIIRM